MPTAAEIRVRRGLPDGVPVSSPWGAVQNGKVIADGIVTVSTAGHGGVRVSAKLSKRIPEVFRSYNNWYEEDIDWAVVVNFLPEFFTEDQRESARQTLRSWRWKEWEQHYGEEIPLEDSPHKAADLWREANKDNWISNSAWGDWHPKVPTGMVGVSASKGGDYNNPRYFLIPEDEYDRRTENPSGNIVIDESRHKEWSGPHR